MTRLRVQVFVLAIALILASTQCLAQCVVKPCHRSAAADESVSPCHRHQPPKQTGNHEPCQYLALVSDNPAPPLVFDGLTAGLPAPQLMQLPSILRRTDEASSPPTSPNAAPLLVLRVWSARRPRARL